MRSTSRDRLSPEDQSACRERLYLARAEAVPEAVISLLDHEIEKHRDALEKCVTVEEMCTLQGKVAQARVVRGWFEEKSAAQRVLSARAGKIGPVDGGGY